MSSDQTINILVGAGLQVATLPLDFTKVQAQVRYSNHKTETPRPLLFGREAVSARGLSGLYIGASTMATRAALYSILRFNIYYPLYSTTAAKDKYHTATITHRSVYSGIASAVSAFLLTPLDLVLLRQQTDNTLSTPRGYAGMLDGLNQASKPKVNSLFIASGVNAIKWGLFAGTMMSVYDLASEFWPRTQGEFIGNKPLSVLSAVLFATAVSMPFDNLKTKLQHQQGKYYRNAADCLSKTVTREGFFGLYVGYWHYFARTSVTAIGTIYLVDALRSLAYD